MASNLKIKQKIHEVKNIIARKPRGGEALAQFSTLFHANIGPIREKQSVMKWVSNYFLQTL